MLKTELLPGMPRLAKGPHFLRVSCLVRTGFRFLTLNFFFGTSLNVLTSWMTCTHSKSPTNDISKMIMITQERRVERERGENLHQLTNAEVGQLEL